MDAGLDQQPGNCFDDTPIESFWHSLKVERVHGAGYETRAQAKQDVFSYIEMFYNVERRHSSLAISRHEHLRGAIGMSRRNPLAQVPNKSSTET